MSSAYLFGLALMALASYIDNVRGPLFPLICRTLNLNYGYASWLFTAGNLAALGVSVWLLSATKKSDERPLVVRALVVAAAAILATLMVTNFGGLVAFAALLGAAINSTGALSNLWTLRHSNAENLGRRLCGLHMFYGFASMMGPLAVDGLLHVSKAWQVPFLVVLPTIPLMGWWLRQQKDGTTPVPQAPVATAVAATPLPTLSARTLLLGTMCFYVAAEVFTSAWLVAFLVDVRHMTVETAAPYLTGFFLMIGVTRAMCFWRLDENRERQVLMVALAVAAVAFFLGHRVNPIFFPLVGILGPFFPIFVARASRRYPSYSKQITQHLILAMQATLAVGHFIAGRAADYFGLSNTYYAPPVLMGAVLVGFVILERRKSP